MLDRQGVYWCDEALKPESIDDYVQLRRSSPVPIAAGEVITRRQSFRQWFVRGALDIVQPDVTKVGGISEQRKIAWMANEFGIRYIGHGWNTALGLAADLQLASVFPETTLVEYIGGSPYVDGITVGGFKIDSEGYLEIPAKPGLGIELDRAGLARYTLNPDFLFKA
jgi:L-alanine-DL-glutamate epimerase-like enolase superfamily enzyme